MIVGLFALGCASFLGLSLIFIVRLFKASPAWATATLLVPPIVPIAFISYVRKYRLTACAHIASLLLLTVGFVLLVRAYPDSKPFAELTRLRTVLAPASLGAAFLDTRFPRLSDKQKVGEHLAGDVEGREVIWQQVEWVGGKLAFSNANQMLPSTLVQIDIGKTTIFENDKFQLSVTPNAEHPPAIEVFSRRNEASDAPDIRVYTGGYWLTLDLTKTSKNAFSGYVKLLLPHRKSTWLEGDFIGYTNGVRYQGRDVDRFYDSVDTLRHIAASHTSAHLWKWLEGEPTIKDIQYQSHYEPFRGYATAVVNLGAQGQQQFPIEFIKGESGWIVQPNAAPILAANLELKTHPAASGTVVERNKAVRFDQLSRFVGKTAQLHTYDGRQFSGEILAADKNTLKFRRSVQGSVFDMSIQRGNLAKAVIRQ